MSKYKPVIYRNVMCLETVSTTGPWANKHYDLAQVSLRGFDVLRFDAGYKACDLLYRSVHSRLALNNVNRTATALLHRPGTRLVRGYRHPEHVVVGEAYVVHGMEVRPSVRIREDLPDADVAGAIKGFAPGWHQIIRDGRHRYVVVSAQFDPALVRLAVG